MPAKRKKLTDDQKRLLADIAAEIEAEKNGNLWPARASIEDAGGRIRGLHPCTVSLWGIRATATDGPRSALVNWANAVRRRLRAEA